MNRLPACLLGAALVSLGGAPPPAPPAPPPSLSSVVPSTTGPTPPAVETQSGRATATLSADDRFLDRVPDSLRVMTFNVNWDSIFPDDDPQNDDLRLFNRAESFRRILGAVQPDILCLQEINYLRRDSQLADFLH